MDKLHVAICKTLLEDGEVDNEVSYVGNMSFFVFYCETTQLNIAVSSLGSR